MVSQSVRVAWQGPQKEEEGTSRKAGSGGRQLVCGGGEGKGGMLIAGPFLFSCERQLNDLPVDPTPTPFWDFFALSV